MRAPSAVRLVLAVCCTTIIACPVPSGAQSPPSTQPATSRIVAINDDGGGAVIDYAARMFRLKASGNAVHFEGRCDSACTLYLALPIDQTCVTQGAIFRFHAPTSATNADVSDVQGFLMRQYPAWVKSWLVRHGGLTHDLITMKYDYARQFIRTCA